MRKVLVLGAGGMAGHVVTRYLKETRKFDVTSATGRNAIENDTLLLDLTDKPALDTFLTNNHFDVVVNCVGALVQASEGRKDLAAYLNSYLPHYLEQVFSEKSTRVIHLSTDCVFSGTAGPYDEHRFPDGELFYDRSKALGELVNDKDLTFRMSIIGPDAQSTGIGLFNWFMAQQGQIRGFSSAIWNGVTTITLAQAIEAAIDQNLTGLYHLVPDVSISKFDLIRLFNDEFMDGNLSVVKDDRAMPDKTLLNTRQDFNFKIEAYPAQIHVMRNWIAEHSELYPHYTIGK